MKKIKKKTEKFQANECHLFGRKLECEHKEKKLFSFSTEHHKIYKVH